MNETEELRQRIKKLENVVEQLQPTRRQLLAGGAGLAGLLGMSGVASAQTEITQNACVWLGNNDANDFDLNNLNALAGRGLTGGDELTNIAGTNLNIDSNGNLNASGGGGSPGGSDSELQYNDAGSFGGLTGTAYDGSTTIDWSSYTFSNLQSMSTSDVTVTNNIDITGETYIEAYRSTNATNITAGTLTNVVDTEVADVNDEFNSSQQFSPDTTGRYIFAGTVFFQNGTAGDEYDVLVRNVTDGVNLNFTRYGDGGVEQTVPIYFEGEFNSSKNYEFLAKNNDSSFDLNSGESKNRVTIKKSIIHP